MNFYQMFVMFYDISGLVLYHELEVYFSELPTLILLMVVLMELCTFILSCFLPVSRTWWLSKHSKKYDLVVEIFPRLSPLRFSSRLAHKTLNMASKVNIAHSLNICRQSRSSSQSIILGGK